MSNGRDTGKPAFIKKHAPRVAIALTLLAAVAAFYALDLERHFTFENVKEQRDLIKQFVDENLLWGLVLYLIAVGSTAFFVPGTLALTIVGGFLFGALRGAALLNLGATLGACIAFLLSRYVIGRPIQSRYPRYFGRLNKIISEHGPHYLFMLRIIPIMPFFAVNYLAGLTRVRLWTFAWTTVLGLLPGSLIYSYAGGKLATIEKPSDILSPGTVVLIALVAIVGLSPLVVSHWKKKRGGKD